MLKINREKLPELFAKISESDALSPHREKRKKSTSLNGARAQRFVSTSFTPTVPPKDLFLPPDRKPHGL